MLGQIEGTFTIANVIIAIVNILQIPLLITGRIILGITNDIGLRQRVILHIEMNLGIAHRFDVVKTQVATSAIGYRLYCPLLLGSAFIGLLYNVTTIRRESHYILLIASSLADNLISAINGTWGYTFSPRHINDTLSIGLTRLVTCTTRHA